MYCHCKITGSNIEARTPIRTVVDSNDICIHCGYYALNSIENYQRTMSDKYKDENVECNLDLIQLWRVRCQVDNDISC